MFLFWVCFQPFLWGVRIVPGSVFGGAMMGLLRQQQSCMSNKRMWMSTKRAEDAFSRTQGERP
jgi:hypothetical protein